MSGWKHNTARSLRGRLKQGYVRKRTTFRVNPLKGDREAVLREIADAGIAVEPIAWYDDAFLLPDGNEEQLRARPATARARFTCNRFPRCCQRWCLRRKQAKPCWTWRLPRRQNDADGGAVRRQGAHHRLREKRDSRRPPAIQPNAAGCARREHHAAGRAPAGQPVKFDKILLDAPCSGSGTLLLEDGEPQRRMTADWLAKTAKTQKVLLQKALSLLPKKHEMVYSTCSVLQMENEDIVQSAVSMGICEVVPIEHPFLTDVPLLPTKVDGVVCVKPEEMV